MEKLDLTPIYCPYCGEKIVIQIIEEDIDDSYIEDCQVCCRPMLILISMDERGKVQIQARDENDA